jgi:hypothetical protein
MNRDLTNSSTDDYTKGYQNAGLMHFRTGGANALPSNVWGGNYFKLNTGNRTGYGYYYPNGAWCYRNRINSGH